MDSSRSSLPNVDRANSTLFKRYLDEQHKSVDKSSPYQTISRPINSTIQITHTHRQQQETYTTKLTDANTSLQQIIIKRKYSNSRKPSADPSRQRTSHTSRFMKRFQRQHKTGETTTNVQKRDGRLLFEFPESITSNRIDHSQICTCRAVSDKRPGHHHDHNCPLKRTQLPRLSLNELFHTSSDQRRVPSPTKLMLPSTTTDSPRQISISNRMNPFESTSSVEPLMITNNTESESFPFDNPPISISDEQWPLISDLLQELSTEMTDKPNVDILLEIEESLAQRIYDCIVEQEDNDNENDTQSYSTLTNDSSALSAPAPVNNPNNLPSSPINTITTREPIDNKDKYFQPIRERPSSSFEKLLDQNRHSTPFNLIKNQISTDTRSPFAQSLFEPVNLLRTVASSDAEDFNFFRPSFTFENQSTSQTNLASIQQSVHSHSVSFPNHLLPPRPAPLDTTTLSAFKPIEPANIRPTTSFALKRPQMISSTTVMDWFGQS
ncbi:unnamed protein product [Adineta ricciae]|uniref:Uncharacterized protein n=1 Tax=Adineta ricciae TaxID=249248 RepID=A0A813V9E0_ADIRI|nr:unnamed protein product [Adineta ricciae]